MCTQTRFGRTFETFKDECAIVIYCYYGILTLDVKIFHMKKDDFVLTFLVFVCKVVPICIYAAFMATITIVTLLIFQIELSVLHFVVEKNKYNMVLYISRLSSPLYDIRKASENRRLLRA